jgi:hypothetical protein
MRSLRRQSRTEEVKIPQEITSSKSTEEELDAKDDRLGKVISADIEAVRLEYQGKLEALEEENKKLKQVERKLNKNEEKLLAAIKSEMANQATQKPIIGRKALIEEYKIGPKYLGDAIKGLLSKKIISKKYVNYTQKIKTSQWEVLIS